MNASTAFADHAALGQAEVISISVGVISTQVAEIVSSRTSDHAP